MKNNILKKVIEFFKKKKEISHERTKLQKLQDRVEFYKENGYWE